MSGRDSMRVHGGGAGREMLSAGPEHLTCTPSCALSSCRAPLRSEYTANCRPAAAAPSPVVPSLVLAVAACRT